MATCRSSRPALCCLRQSRWASELLFGAQGHGRLLDRQRDDAERPSLKNASPCGLLGARLAKHRMLAWGPQLALPLLRRRRKSLHWFNCPRAPWTIRRPAEGLASTLPRGSARMGCSARTATSVFGAANCMARNVAPSVRGWDDRHHLFEGARNVCCAH